MDHLSSKAKTVLVCLFLFCFLRTYLYSLKIDLWCRVTTRTCTQIFLLQSNTFQAVLITNGFNTFLMYNYPYGGIQWVIPADRWVVYKMQQWNVLLYCCKLREVRWTKSCSVIGYTGEKYGAILSARYFLPFPIKNKWEFLTFSSLCFILCATLKLIRSYKENQMLKAGIWEAWIDPCRPY